MNHPIDFRHWDGEKPLAFPQITVTSSDPSSSKTCAKSAVLRMEDSVHAPAVAGGVTPIPPEPAAFFVRAAP